MMIFYSGFILKEHSVSVHPTIIVRWVHKYGDLVYQMWRKKKICTPCLHVDES